MENSVGVWFMPGELCFLPVRLPTDSPTWEAEGGGMGEHYDYPVWELYGAQEVLKSKKNKWKRVKGVKWYSAKKTMFDIVT